MREIKRFPGGLTALFGPDFCQHTHFCGPLKQSTAANIPCERWLVIEKVIYLLFIKFQQK